MVHKIKGKHNQDILMYRLGELLFRPDEIVYHRDELLYRQKGISISSVGIIYRPYNIIFFTWPLLAAVDYKQGNIYCAHPTQAIFKLNSFKLQFHLSISNYRYNWSTCSPHTTYFYVVYQQASRSDPNYNPSINHLL